MSHTGHIRIPLFIIVYLALSHIIHKLFKRKSLSTRPMKTGQEETEPEVESIISKIEQQCGGQTVSIETQLTTDSLAKCHLQEQSPLFRDLPMELRAGIFAYATLPFDDPKHQYKDTDFWYRLGHSAKHSTETALLLTCRRVWLEANSLPMLQAQHCFFFRDVERVPLWARSTSVVDDIVIPDDNVRLRRFVQDLTPNNRAILGHVHLFAQMYWLETRLRSLTYTLHPLLFGSSGIMPKILTITIKHTDWWYWERDQPLRFHTHWLQDFLNIPLPPSGQSCELRLELETLALKIHQLRPIVDDIRRLEGAQRYDEAKRVIAPRFVRADYADPPEQTWSGPTDINRVARQPYAGLKKLDYRIVTIVWKSTKPVATPPIGLLSTSTVGMLDETPERSFPSSSLHPVLHTRAATTVPQPVAAGPKKTDIEHRQAFDACSIRWREENSLLKFV